MDWSYVAGYFDGEGHVSLHKTSRGDFARGLSWYNTHLDSLKAMRDFMGCGNISSREKRHGRNYAPHTLTISKKADCLRVLEHLIPLLIVKRDAAIRLRSFFVEHVDETRVKNFGVVANTPIETLVSWYEGGMTLNEIGQKLGGVNGSAVGASMKRRGAKLRQRTDMRGKAKSAQARANMSASRKKLWADPEWREQHLNKMRESWNRRKSQ